MKRIVIIYFASFITFFAGWARRGREGHVGVGPR